MSDLVLPVLQTTNLLNFCNELRNSNCKACELGNCYVTNKPVVSRGSLDAKIMLCGEAPGETESELGLPFTGRAGQLLNQLLGQLSLDTNKDCYISNVCRCRPSNNRVPTSAEAKLCSTYLKHEISLLKPSIVVCLGKTAAQYLIPSIKSSTLMKALVGKYYTEVPGFEGTTFMVTYHPAFLLRPNGHAHQSEFLNHFNSMLEDFGIREKVPEEKQKLSSPFNIRAPEKVNKNIWNL